MARCSLFSPAMRKRNGRECRCSYVVVPGHDLEPDALRELSRYLSTLGVMGCDVVVLDPSPSPLFECNGRVLRWVARHVPVGAEHCTPSGLLDRVQAASSVAASEKVIVASEDVRYTADAIARLVDLLDVHEVAEPQDYLEPLPWWGSVEAGRILLHRGIEPQPDHGATFAFCRGAVRNMRGRGSGSEDSVRRLANAGIDVFPAADVFVRRAPGTFDQWIEARPRIAAGDFSLPFKSAFFFSIVPLLLLLAIFGGWRLAGVSAGAIAFSAVGLALNGRTGASAYFPLRSCLFAPLWVFERSISVYWALFRKFRGREDEASRIVAPDPAKKVASGG
jgi:hypothetical protein